MTGGNLSCKPAEHCSQRVIAGMRKDIWIALHLAECTLLGSMCMKLTIDDRFKTKTAKFASLSLGAKTNVITEPGGAKAGSRQI